MSKKLIDALRKERDDAKKSIETILEKAENGTTLGDTEKKNLDDLTKSATELDARIKELTEMELARIEATSLDLKLDNALSEFGSLKHADVHKFEETQKSLGSMFTESDVYKSYLQTPAGKSGLFTASEFTLIDTVGGTIPGVDRTSDSPMPSFVTPLLSAIGYEPVSSNSIEWISWPAIPPTAGVVAEGAVKPEATYAPLLNSKALDKLAHHIPVTREMLEDVPRTRSIVTNALLNGVRKKAEADAVARLIGVTLPLTASGETLLKAVRVGVGMVSDGGWNPDCVVLNPLDYALIDIDLLDYTVNGAVLGKSIWGMKVVPAAAVPSETAYVIDSKNSMTFFDRRVTNVYITDSHADEFTSNILRILAEGRSRTEIIRPEAIAECTVTPPVAG